MKKEIIGYRLVKPEYYQASSYIMYENMAGSISLDDYLSTDHYALHRLEDAGVLDLWFEPVYKEKEKEFEFGRWYKDGNYLYFIDNDRFYGFSCLGHWVDKERVGLNMKGWQPATDTEVKERLLAYAKDKYVVGTRYKNTETYEPCTVKDNLENFSNVQITDYNGGSVYFKGKWAEIISEPEKETELRGALRRAKEAIDKLNNLM